jgi:hypothetical protein
VLGYSQLNHICGQNDTGAIVGITLPIKFVLRFTPVDGCLAVDPPISKRKSVARYILYFVDIREATSISLVEMIYKALNTSYHQKSHYI